MSNEDSVYVEEHTFVVHNRNNEEDASTLYSLSPTQRAEAFLEERGSSIHPIFDSAKPELPDSSQITRSASFSASTRKQTEQFLEVIDTYQSASTDGSTRLVDLRARHSWDDMIKAADNAQKAYEVAGLNFFRKTGRKIASRAEMAQPWLRLIPNDFFASIFYGSLRLVFEACSHVDERRSKVLKAFLRIPNVIILAESCVENFPSDEVLFQRAESVFCAALPAIEGTMRWLKQNPAKKQIRALILGSVYNKSYKEKLQLLDESLNELQERVSVLRDQSIRKIENTVRRTDTQMTTVADKLNHISEAQDHAHSKASNAHELDEVREQAHEAIKIVLEQQLMTSEWMQAKDRDIRRLKKQIEALEKVEVGLTESDLLDILHAGPGLASQDMRQVQRSCRSAELSELDMVHSILSSKKMSEWLQKDAASALLIESDSTRSLNRNTPLSLLCTDVVESLFDKEPAVPIFFFCGLHTSMQDPLRGPNGIIRSLITQLLQLYSPKLDFVSRRYRQQLEALHLYTLCDCFCKLVRRLPNKTVLVCVIDGISFFENKEWASGCRELMSHLQGLLEDDEVNPVFKLLVTSPVRSRHVRNIFTDDCRISLQSHDFSNARHGLTEREIALNGARPSRPITTGPRMRSTLRRTRFRFQLPAQGSDSSHSELDTDSDLDSDGFSPDMTLDEEEQA